MRVSAKSDYALRALIEMASRDRRARRSAPRSSAGSRSIPHGFLQAILADLRQAGIVIAAARPVRRLADGPRRRRTSRSPT